MPSSIENDIVQLAQSEDYTPEEEHRHQGQLSRLLVEGYTRSIEGIEAYDGIPVSYQVQFVSCKYRSFHLILPILEGLH